VATFKRAARYLSTLAAGSRILQSRHSPRIPPARKHTDCSCQNGCNLACQSGPLLLFECDVSHAAQKRPLILRIEETEALRNLLLQCRLNENLKTNEVFDVNQTAPLSY